MAAKGAIIKQEIIEKILQVFPDSFLFNEGKEVRINGEENGEIIQIKVTLTASKTPIQNPTMTTVERAAATDEQTAPFPAPIPAEENSLEPSEEEKKRLVEMLQKLNLS